jgi:phage gp36-like protein
MAYHAQADLEARWTTERIAEIFSEQASDGSTTGEVNAASLDAAIADSDAEIDSILGGVFTTPFEDDDVDPMIVTLACDMTPWNGCRRRPVLLGQPSASMYEKMYDRAISILKEIREGKRIISSNRTASNVGGEVVSDSHVEDATPHYFIQNRTTGEGGLDGY